MVTLGYWNTRCEQEQEQEQESWLAQPIRLMLKYVGQEFEDKRYQVGPPPEWNKDCWLSVKHKLGLDFPNLPYYIDDDVKISQSMCIMRYLGRKHGLYGKTEQEGAMVDQVLEEARDFHWAWIDLCYDPKFHELQHGYKEKLQPKLQSFESFLGDKKWFLGDNISPGDFVMYEVLDQHLIWDADCLMNYLKLKAFHQRFEELPPIKAYLAADDFLVRPLNNIYSTFH